MMTNRKNLQGFGNGPFNIPNKPRKNVMQRLRIAGKSLRGGQQLLLEGFK